MIWLIRLAPAVIAVICVILAFVPVRRSKVAHPVNVTGTIVGSRIQKIYRNGNELQALAPVVRYETASGEITAASRDYLPEWQYGYHSGDTVELTYDKEQPDVFVLRSSGSDWRRAAFLTAGVGTLIAAGVLWVQYH